MFLNTPKVLCCRKIEDGPLFFNTLVGLIKNPEVEAHPQQYTVKAQILIADSYEEFKSRKFIRVPVSAILMIECLDLQKLKNYRLIDSGKLYEMPL